jgi:hypothetical protein
VASIVEFIYSQDIQDEDLINLLKKRKSVQWFILASIAHSDYFENNGLTLKEKFKVARSITSSILGCEADISKYHIVETDVKKIKVISFDVTGTILVHKYPIMNKKNSF